MALLFLSMRTCEYSWGYYVKHMTYFMSFAWGRYYSQLPWQLAMHMEKLKPYFNKQISHKNLNTYAMNIDVALSIK